MSVCAAALVAGVTDSVTQLPAAAMMVTVVCFAGLERKTDEVRPRRAPLATAAVVLMLGALACCSVFASRLISTASITTFDDLAFALRLDPTNVKARAELARALVSAGRCEEAAFQLPVVLRQQPVDGAKITADFKTACLPRLPTSTP